MRHRQPLWTIEELGARVAVALSTNYDGQSNGQVREVPDRRSIRYYTTLGLIDGPAEMRGRKALYGQRHLLQLVAIKRLQARGLSLMGIQQQLLGISGAALRRLAQLPASLEAPSPSTAPPAGPGELAEEERGESFWRATPAAVCEPRENDSDEGNAEWGAASPSALQGIPLADEATLLLSAVRPVYEEDIQAIRVAAAPLLKLLETRRLLRRRQERRRP